MFPEIIKCLWNGKRKLWLFVNWHTDKYIHMRNGNRIRISSMVRQLNVVSCVFVRMCHQVIRVKVMSLTTTVARLSQFSKSDLILLTA